ncbi:uncharacterized protein N7483_001869 [Penicillium malachiteum]|uniref:uncharacterized protein n=1 Tax=Penicillium malachiteum TaxID=1324776 RepID=UPI00254791D5|nr:uncharacterized protein N7483_001869 [Penicillium malachiteum]KAJ5736744.1 hypothetical protein N7483_001869 [Penicillium malachiteum]
MRAEHDSYHAKEGPERTKIRDRVNTLKTTPVGRKHFPEESHRDSLEEGKLLSGEGRWMANIEVQGRAWLSDKYPNGYTERGQRTHVDQTNEKMRNAAAYGADMREFDTKLPAWNRQRQKRGL